MCSMYLYLYKYMYSYCDFIHIGHMIEAQQFVLAVVPVPDHDDLNIYIYYTTFLGQVMAKTKIKSKTK